MNAHDDRAQETEVRIPAHVAIIMDGNGRWAKQRGLPRTEGHRKGVEAVRRTVRAAMELGVGHLTLFSFSSENWSRPASEVSDLMGLLRRFIQRDLADLHKNGVRIRVLGTNENVAPDIIKTIEEAVKLTDGNTSIELNVAFNYGSRREIALAAQRVAEQVAAGTLSSDAITPDVLSANLDTAGTPDPDLLIRTSGEKRISNFLLWQLAYTELVFTDVLWPDFSKEHLEAAIAEYQLRDRRYGGLTARTSA
ncbi:MAG: isoprenyl transferase [Hyphomicrobiaceae bacterium]